MLVESLQTVSVEEMAVYLENKLGGKGKAREIVS